MRPAHQRINKYLSSLGYGSRRQIDALIQAGKITVNQKTALLGQRVTPQDRISINGKPISSRPRQKMVIAFHKPAGVTTTKGDRFAKRTVMSYLPPSLQHLNPVGRLDRQSRGLLLLTNDGDIAQRLTHPSGEHDKEYEIAVTPYKKTSLATFNQDMNRLATTVVDSRHQSKVPKVINRSFDQSRQQGFLVMILQEGKKRQIRELLRALGYRVIDLKRTRIASIRLADLPEGEYVTISPHHFSL